MNKPKCSLSTCLEKRKESNNEKNYQNLFQFLSFCSDCKAAEVKGTQESITLNIVKRRFDHYFYNN